MKIFCVLIITLVLSITTAGASIPASFFPTRPSPVTLKTLTGTLVSYEIGNTAGQLAIKSGSVTTVFFVALPPMTINGVKVKCPLPPMGNATPDPLICSDWPSTVIIGQSNMKVTYWKSTYAGKAVNVTDQIDSSP
jgi:hypothetical protein